MKKFTKILKHGPSAVIAAIKGSSREGKSCPYCGTPPVLFANRGRISKVFECRKCSLLYGWPKQDSGFNAHFYQDQYAKSQECFTTQVPAPSALPKLISEKFTSIDKNIDWVVELFRRIKAKGRLLDYGCSWGYSLRQFCDAGYMGVGLEVCLDRSAYGRNHLGLEIHDGPEPLLATSVAFDFIYTSHVLEHLPDPGIALRLFEQVAAPGCILLIRVPNCGGKNARNQGIQWGPFSSVIHPMSYRAEFFEKCLPSHGFEVRLVTSEPYSPDSYFGSIHHGRPCHDDGDDLIIIAIRTIANEG